MLVLETKTDIYSFISELAKGMVFKDTDSVLRVVLHDFDTAKEDLLKLNDEILAARLKTAPCPDMYQNKLGLPVQVILVCEYNARVSTMKVYSRLYPEHFTIVRCMFPEKI